MTGKESKHRWGSFFTIFAAVLIFSLSLATFAFSSHVSPETRILNRISLTSLDTTGQNGSFLIEVKSGTDFIAVGKIPFNRYYRTDTLSFSIPESDMIYIRITKQGGGAAHIDAVQLGDSLPSSLNGASVQKICSADYDVVDATAHPVEICFETDDSFGGQHTLSVTARIESEQISKVPFHYPRENLFKEITENSTFYTYKLGSQQGRINVDGVLEEEVLKDPLFSEYIRVDSGHPQGKTLGWVMDDGENLFVSMDFTADNTLDGTADYAKVYARTPEGVKEFKVSSVENHWGKAGFSYTEAVAYQHKSYEFCIPLSELGIKTLHPESVRSNEVNIELAFAAYGTASPGETYISLAYDPTHHQYLAAFIYEQLVYGQLLNGNGDAIGSSFQISSFVAYDAQTDVAFNPVSNRYLVVWHDGRNSVTSGTDIFGQLVNADGSLYPDPGTPSTNLTLCCESTNQYSPTVAADTKSGRFFVVWADYRNGSANSDIYGQSVNSNGTLYPTPGDTTTNIPICTYADGQFLAEVSYGLLSDRYLVAWVDARDQGTNDYDIYGQIVNGDGSLYPSGSESHIVICNDTSRQTEPCVGNDSVNGRFIVCWTDSRNVPSSEDIYGQILNSDGSLYYPSADPATNIPISTATRSQREPRVSFNPKTERFCVAWKDDRASVSWDIYMQLVDTAGALYPSSDPTVNSAIATTSNPEEYPDVSTNPFCSNFIIVYGEEYDPGSGNEYFLTVASSSACSPDTGMLAFPSDTNSGVSPEAGSAGTTFSFNVEYWGNSMPQKAELILGKGTSSAGFLGPFFLTLSGTGTPTIALFFIVGMLILLIVSGIGLTASIRRKRPAIALITTLTILILTTGVFLTTCGTSESSGGLTMTEVDPSDNNCIDGKEYQFSVILSESGTYNYHFSFKDWNGAACFGTPTQQMTLPVN